MEKKENMTKVIIPAILGVLVLIVVVAGATYAYFTVTATNNFTEKSISATTPIVGSVTLTSGADLSMNITAAQMMESAATATYYAPATGSEATTTETSPVIATAEVTGEGTYNCDYTITVTPTVHTLYDAFSAMATKGANQIVLTVAGQAFDFNTTDMTQVQTISGTLNGLTSSTAEASRQLTAQLKFVNTSSVQDDLKDKTQTFQFTATNWSCVAVD